MSRRTRRPDLWTRQQPPGAHRRHSTTGGSTPRLRSSSRTVPMRRASIARAGPASRRSASAIAAGRRATTTIARSCDELRQRDVRLVCLAGFMRRRRRAADRRLSQRHPQHPPVPSAVVPRCRRPAAGAEHGVKTSGVTVHFVTADLDAGPIIVQRPVPCWTETRRRRSRRESWSRSTAPIPRRLHLVLEGGWRLDGRRFLRSPTVRRSVTTATSGGQLIRTGT